MSHPLDKFAYGLLSGIDLWRELRDLKELGFTEEEILGWLDMYVDEYLFRWQYHEDVKDKK